MDRFFIADGYRENPATSLDLDENRNYWDPGRVRTALYYQREVYAWADTIIGQHDLKTVADLGCGFAYKLHWLYKQHPEVEFWGIDQPNAIRLCREHYGFGCWLGVDLENPEPPGRNFDLVISSDVIEHLENPDVLLSYIKSISAPGGYVLLSTPERDRLRGENCRHSPNEAHVREWNYEEFSSYVASRGFEILEHRLLSARVPSFSLGYLRKALRRMVRGRSTRYNQALLLQVE